MLPERTFRRVDRARLDAVLTRRALAGAAPWVERLAQGHAEFRFVSARNRA